MSYTVTLCVLVVFTVVRGNTYLIRGLAEIDYIVECSYSNTLGTFIGENLWQSGNTLETICNGMILANISKWFPLLSNTFQKTPVVVDNCFDDHQWWLLGWIRAYEATSQILYLKRAEAVFDYVAANAWTTSPCGGGVIWCPSTNSPYKNAITNELFLASAMSLHPYTKLLGRPNNFYLNWALMEWDWFKSSGMINSANLINDGLNDQCKNNGQTTWTYNQGVLLSGLGMLTKATGDLTYVNKAVEIVKAVVLDLTVKNEILHEPCSSCDEDQNLFKGIFMRHLGYLGLHSSNVVEGFCDFVTKNADSLLSLDGCKTGQYGHNWEGPPSTCNTATTSSAIDALLTTFIFHPSYTSGLNKKGHLHTPDTVTGNHDTKKKTEVVWVPLGLGNCEDSNHQSMPNCNTANVDEVACQNACAVNAGAVAYDFQQKCDGGTFCRVRTLSGSSGCLKGWAWDNGVAKNVTGCNGGSLTICVLKQ